MMMRASGNSPPGESSAGSLPIPGGGGAAAESLPELDLGGDLYRWGTHQLASSFPSIGDHGDIIQSKLPQPFGHAPEGAPSA